MIAAMAAENPVAEQGACAAPFTAPTPESAGFSAENDGWFESLTAHLPSPAATLTRQAGIATGSKSLISALASLGMHSTLSDTIRLKTFWGFFRKLSGLYRNGRCQ